MNPTITDIFYEQSVSETLDQIQRLIESNDNYQTLKEKPIIILMSDDYWDKEIKISGKIAECQRIFVELGEFSNFDKCRRFVSSDVDFFKIANADELLSVFDDLTNRVIALSKGTLNTSNFIAGLPAGFGDSPIIRDVGIPATDVAVFPGAVGIVVGMAAIVEGSVLGFPIPTRLSRILNFFRGNKEESPKSSENNDKVANIKNVREVQFAAIAPENFAKGELSMIDILMYEEEYKYILEDIRQEYETKVKKRKYGYQKIEDDTIVRIELNSNSPQIVIEDNEIIEKWNGKYLRFSFLIKLPQNYKEKQISFKSKVYFNDVLATTINFIALCKSDKKQKLNAVRKDIESAFISYSSKDLNRVLDVVQGIQKIRPDLDIFIDKKNLKSGDIWEKVLKREIESRDIFYLF